MPLRAAAEPLYGADGVSWRLDVPLATSWRSLKECKMRSVVTALAIGVLLAIWLIAQYPDDERSNEVLAGREVATGTKPPELDVPAADQEVLPATTPDEIISDVKSVTETVEFQAFGDPATRAPAIEFDPEQRGKIVDYLSGRGLAVVDSERIADSALAGTKECISQAFGSNGATSNSIETCIFNVLAAYGLNEAAVVH
jgi:hypothetical protein